MKRKLACVITVLLMIGMLCGCGTDPKTVDYNGKSYDDLVQEAVVNAYYVNLIQANYQGKEIPDSEIEEIISSNTTITRNMFEAYPKWSEVTAEYGECGTFMDESFDPATYCDGDNFVVAKSGSTLTTDLTLKFGERDVIFELVYDTYSMEITGIGIDPVQSLSEKMSNAGKNTLISMSIVFSVLILISLIISCFKVFPYLEEKKKNKNNKKAETDSKEEEAASVPATPVAQTDDAELIAVIAAAIAASEGTSTSDFVVRSINRR